MANLDPYIQSPFNKSRLDKFLFVLNLPDALKSVAQKFNRTDNNINPDTLQFSIFGVNIPDINIPSMDIRYAGQTLAQSTHSRPPYEPCTVNFTIDNRFNNYWVIYSWLNLLNDQSTGEYDPKDLTKKSVISKQLTNKDIGTNSEYKSDISIFTLDEYDKRIMEFKFKKAFPITLGGSSLNYRNASEAETYFTFGYSQFIVDIVEHLDSL